MCEVGEAAQLRRYLPTQLVLVEAQHSDASLDVGGDVLPLAD